MTLRADLAAQLARLKLAYEMAEADLAYLRSHGDVHLATIASLGTSEVALVLLYLAGVAWRHHFGPAGPVFPVDR